MVSSRRLHEYTLRYNDGGWCVLFFFISEGVCVRVCVCVCVGLFYFFLVVAFSAFLTP